MDTPNAESVRPAMDGEPDLWDLRKELGLSGAHRNISRLKDSDYSKLNDLVLPGALNRVQRKGRRFRHGTLLMYALRSNVKLY